MSSADLAIDYARRLINAEARSPGDVEDAMHRLEARTGIGKWTYWGLWNRRRKVIDRDLFAQIRAAYLAHCEGQIARLQHDIALDAARCGDDIDQDLLAQAEAILAKIRARKTAG